MLLPRTVIAGLPSAPGKRYTPGLTFALDVITWPGVRATSGTACAAGEAIQTTPSESAIRNCLIGVIASNRERIGIPRNAELLGPAHIAEHGGCRDDRRRCEEPLAAVTHAILPVAIE